MKKVVALALVCVALAGCDFVNDFFIGPISTPTQSNFFDAIVRHDLKAVTADIASGRISIDENFPYGQKPLHLAAYYGAEEIVDYLVKNGANINAAMPSASETPLHTAINRGHEDVAIQLLDLGADPSINYGRYTTCCLVKRMRKWKDMSRLIARLPGCKDAKFDNKC